MGQYDIALRHVVHRHGKDLAQVLVPRFPVESVAWADTQFTHRERRLDRALELRGQGRRQLLHVELAVRAKRRLAYRMFEYAAQMVMAEQAIADPPVGDDEEVEADDLDDLALPAEPHDAADAEGDLEELAAVPVESAVILLSGRKKPWPRRGRFRTSARGRRFSGQSFRIEAVYQRTVAELLSRPGSFWLVFTPLAVDANAQAIRQLIEEIACRESEEEDRADLYAAMLVLAELDTWGHNLREEIRMQLRELDRNAIMKSPTLREVFEDGIEKGRQQLLEEMLRGLLARHLQRELTPGEQAAVSARANTLTGEQVTEVVHRLHGDALHVWLLGPDAE
jgi:hypothetical protein